MSLFNRPAWARTQTAPEDDEGSEDELQPGPHRPVEEREDDDDTGEHGGAAGRRAELLRGPGVSTHRTCRAVTPRRSGRSLPEELLIPKDELQRTWILRKVLNPLSPVEAMELLSDKLGKTRNNSEFLHNMNSL